MNNTEFHMIRVLSAFEDLVELSVLSVFLFAIACIAHL